MHVRSGGIPIAFPQVLSESQPQARSPTALPALGFANAQDWELLETVRGAWVYRLPARDGRFQSIGT